MRTLFDQYTQPENRLTHALACVLNEDRTLLAAFLKWLDVPPPPAKRRLRIVEQEMPGALVSGEDEQDRTLPDLCVFDEESGWAVVVSVVELAGDSKPVFGMLL